MRQLLNFLEPLFWMFLAFLGLASFFLGIAIVVVLTHHMMVYGLPIIW
jgi:hypothetical protein